MSRRSLVALAVAALVGTVALVVLRGAQRVPDDPQPIVWDRETCAHCRMLIGAPSSAAQLIAGDGTVSSFDDPGCLMTFLEERRPNVHRIWLHHHSEDRWLAPADAGFVRGDTPMGFNLVAVDGRTPGAVAWDEARTRPRTEPR